MLHCPLMTSTQGLADRFRFPLVPAAASGRRVTTAFRRVLEHDEPTLVGELHAATLAFAATLKAEGFPPEQVVIALKRAIGRDGWWPTLIPDRRLNRMDQSPEGRLYGRVFYWLLEGYFS